jgi:hypothetical protein
MSSKIAKFGKTVRRIFFLLSSGSKSIQSEKKIIIKPLVGWLMSSRSPKDFRPIQLCVFIDFGLEQIKKIFGSSKN